MTLKDKLIAQGMKPTWNEQTKEAKIQRGEQIFIGKGENEDDALKDAAFGLPEGWNGPLEEND